jgi:hypothetical protein
VTRESASVLAAGVLVSALLLAGCTKDVTHPPFVNSSCAVPPCAGGTTPGGGKTPTDAGLAADANASLSGELAIFNDADFLTTSPFLGSGTVDVFTPKGPATGITGAYSGSRYSLDDVTDAVFWGEIAATGATDVLPTLSPISSRRRDAANIAFARSSAISQIFSNLVQGGQGTLTGRGHIALKFVDSASKPLAGVQMSVVPDGATVAYDDGPLYSDRATLGATQARGTAVVLNATAPEWPGGLFELKYKSGSASSEYSVDVFIAAGAVTVITVPAPVLP